MFQNNNKEILLDIAKALMGARKTRNRVACFAIILTSLLITSVCGAGIGTVQAVIREKQVVPGPGAYGMTIYGGAEVLEQVRQYPQVEWADIARACSGGNLRNREFAGQEVKLFGVNTEYFAHHYVTLLDGAYPADAGEILISDTLAKHIGMEQTPGQTFPLQFIKQVGGDTEVTVQKVTVSGFYCNPLSSISNYEEVYTTMDFPDLFNPELGDTTSMIYPKLKGITVYNQGDYHELLSEISQAVGGYGVRYMYPPEFQEEAKNAVIVLLLVMACGYFLIYNVFHISVMNDIRFIGNMKTIGMTKKQVQTIFGWQIRRIGAVGILIGILIGSGLNILIIQFLKSSAMSYSDYFQTDISLLLAASAAALFSLITVWISSHAALLLAGKISPVEAARFRSSGKMKAFLSVLSFSLSGILFCALFTATIGYDTYHLERRMFQSDYKVLQNHSIQPMREPYEPMSQDFAKQVEDLDFVEESYRVYNACNLKADGGEAKIWGESVGEVLLEGRIREVAEQEYRSFAMRFSEESREAYVEEHLTGPNLQTGIIGMDANLLDFEKNNVFVYDGELDKAKFATGEYLIYLPMGSRGAGEEFVYDGLKAGEVIELSFYDFDREQYVTKSFTVLAVAGVKPDNYATEWGMGAQFILSEQAFLDIYKETGEQMLGNLVLFTSGEDWKAEQKILEQMIAEEFNTQIVLDSRYAMHAREVANRNRQIGIGLFVALAVGLIGLTNLINTIVSNVLSRKLEFATLQSIGMTKRQMTEAIWKDGIRLVLSGSIVILVIGFFVTGALVKIIATGFVPLVYAQSCLLVLGTGLLLVFLAARILTKNLNRNTLVERLREAE